MSSIRTGIDVCGLILVDSGWHAFYAEDFTESVLRQAFHTSHPPESENGPLRVYAQRTALNRHEARWGCLVVHGWLMGDGEFLEGIVQWWGKLLKELGERQVEVRQGFLQVGPLGQKVIQVNHLGERS